MSWNLSLLGHCPDDADNAVVQSIVDEAVEKIAAVSSASGSLSGPSISRSYSKPEPAKTDAANLETQTPDA